MSRSAQTVAELKQQVKAERGLAPELQVVMYQGRRLRDEQTLAQSRLKSNIIVQVLTVATLVFTLWPQADRVCAGACAQILLRPAPVAAAS